jgi:Protein of unknown function (DUF3007)
MQWQDMTYVKQLEDYEEAVMAKRLAEMPADELERLLAEVLNPANAKRLIVFHICRCSTCPAA